MSTPYPVEQFRKNYVFLAPDDYDISYADIVSPPGTAINVDGTPVSGTGTPVGNYVITRVKLGPGNGGAHTLVAGQPVGLQVIGYGSYTSYQYPGGGYLNRIAPTPTQ